MQLGLFSRPLDLGSASSRPVSVRFDAESAERAAIATEYGLLSLDSFAAEFEVAAQSRDVFELRGRVRAELSQSCVVSLVPVTQLVDETFRLDLVPAGSPGVDTDGREDRDPPAVYEGSFADLGAIALEYFALGLDPYPRAPGVELATDATSETSSGPFAQLARLRSTQSGAS